MAKVATAAVTEQQPMLPEISELIAARDKLDAQIAQGREKALQTCLQLIRAHRFTTKDLDMVKTREKSNVTYSNGEGGTWAGRGKRPKWLQTAILEGKTLESFKQ